MVLNKVLLRDKAQVTETKAFAHVEIDLYSLFDFEGANMSSVVCKAKSGRVY